MFIAKEILSGALTTRSQLCFSFPQSQNSPALWCSLYFILSAGSFSEQLLSEQLRLPVEITFSVLVPRFSVEPFHLAVLQTPLIGT